jgi:hypothetical protein
MSAVTRRRAVELADPAPVPGLPARTVAPARHSRPGRPASPPDGPDVPAPAFQAAAAPAVHVGGR